ncbi:Uncharacterised protein [Brucella suis]|nr:Uncharacterised protein [Brucella suis]
MLVETIKLLVPERMFMRLVEIEQARVENRIERHLPKIRLLDAGVRVERADNLARQRTFLFRHHGYLVQHHDIGKLDLLDQKIDKRTLVFFTERLAAITQKIT